MPPKIPSPASRQTSSFPLLPTVSGSAKDSRFPSPFLSDPRHSSMSSGAWDDFIPAPSSRSSAWKGYRRSASFGVVVLFLLTLFSLAATDRGDAPIFKGLQSGWSAPGEIELGGWTSDNGLPPLSDIEGTVPENGQGEGSCECWVESTSLGTDPPLISPSVVRLDLERYRTMDTIDEKTLRLNQGGRLIVVGVRGCFARRLTFAHMRTDKP